MFPPYFPWFQRLLAFLICLVEERRLCIKNYSTASADFKHVMKPHRATLYKFRKLHSLNTSSGTIKHTWYPTAWNSFLRNFALFWSTQPDDRARMCTIARDEMLMSEQVWSLTFESEEALESSRNVNAPYTSLQCSSVHRPFPSMDRMPFVLCCALPFYSLYTFCAHCQH